MSGSMNIHVAEVKFLLKNIELTKSDMLSIEKPGALIIVNTQKMLVPVGETGATKAGIGQHIQEASETRVVDHIGPETDYSRYIEFGVISKPNYPIQPFVRPSAFGKFRVLVNKVIETAFAKVVRRKHG